jgi:hypothetical protein
MSHPYHHSLSSVRTFGGKPEDYLAIHCWFDATKAHFADFRHRALRHHGLGVLTAAKVFDRNRTTYQGKLVNSDGNLVSVLEIGTQHVEEDCGELPTLGDWFFTLKHESLPAQPKHLDIAVHCQRSATKWGGEPQDYYELHEWFTLPYYQHGDSRCLGLRYHSQGVFEAEEIFGVTLTNTAGRVVPVRLIGEDHVKAVLGRIPTAYEWLRGIEARTWMRRIGVRLDEQGQPSGV